MPQRLPEIERLRGVAILLTLLGHLGQIAPQYFTHPYLSLWTGVDLFFVISGFLITHSLVRLLPANEQLPLLPRLKAAWPGFKIFFVKRAYRLYPVAAVALLLPLFLSLFYNDSGLFKAPSANLKAIFAVLTGFYNYWISTGVVGFYGVFWSLALEEQFYLFLPLLFAALPQKNSRLLFCVGGIAVISLILRPLLTLPPGETMWFQKAATHRRMDGPLLGVLIALLGLKLPTFSKEKDRLIQWLLVPVLILFLSTVIWLFPFAKLGEDHGHPLNYLWVNLAAGILVLLATANRGLILSVPILKGGLEWMGTRCYSLYLIHPISFTLWREFLFREGWRFPQAFLHSQTGAILQALLVFSLNLLLCDWIYRHIELPFIEKGKRLPAPKANETAPERLAA